MVTSYPSYLVPDKVGAVLVLADAAVFLGAAAFCLLTFVTSKFAYAKIAINTRPAIKQMVPME